MCFFKVHGGRGGGGGGGGPPPNPSFLLFLSFLSIFWSIQNSWIKMSSSKTTNFVIFYSVKNNSCLESN